MIPMSQPPQEATDIFSISDQVLADRLQFIEPLAGRKWYRDEVRERIHDCTTALVTPHADGGLGLAPEGEMVAVMSTNCVVRPSQRKIEKWPGYQRTLSI